MTTKHKPGSALPWEAKLEYDQNGEHELAAATISSPIDDWAIARVWRDYPNGKQDAAYLVHAANAYPRFVASMKRCIAGMPHSAPQEEAIALMRELGEIAPHR